MTNAVGYYHNEREERINRDHPAFRENVHRLKGLRVKDSFDINRDFPYNTKPEDCLNTVAGRLIHQIFTQNIIVSAITFHGGTNVIGYPWGSYNHAIQNGYNGYVSNESPDMRAFDGIG